MLVEIANRPLKKSIRSFQDNLKAEISKIRYFEKICSNYEKNREFAFSLMRNLPNVNGSKVRKLMIAKQLSIICKTLRQK